MRSDMGRLIIEDGRRGDGGPKTCYDKVTRRGEEFENLPSRESMSRHRKQDNNSQGDRLAPLRKYLAAQVGRPWNKVYSEICTTNDRRTLRGYHLLSHVKDYVQVKPEWRYGTVLSREFYVDRHGLLKKSKDYPSWRTRNRNAPKPEITKIQHGESEWFEKIKDTWYRFKVINYAYRVPEKYVSRGSKTVLAQKERIVTAQRTAKFQCGKKELRRIADLLQ